MKKCILLFIAINCCQMSFSQKSIDSVSIRNRKIKKELDSIYFGDSLVFFPKEHKKVNYVNAEFWDVFDGNSQRTQTNGIEFGVNPLTLFTPFLVVIEAFPYITMKPEDLKHIDQIKFDKVNGVRLGIGFFDPSIVKGVEVSIGGNYQTITKGVSITPTINKHYKLEGVGVALLGNYDSVVEGVQIGLFNKTKKLRGFQFGLWNKNGRRSLPLINWQFKD